MVSPRFFFALTILLAAAPIAVGAGTQKVESKITYKNHFEDLMYIHEGEVKSDVRKCERGRTVRLYGEGIDKPFGSDQTNADGEYRFTMETDGIAGDYYTRVRQVEKGSVTCKGAESKHKPVS